MILAATDFRCASSTDCAGWRMRFVKWRSFRFKLHHRLMPKFIRLLFKEKRRANGNPLFIGATSAGKMVERVDQSGEVFCGNNSVIGHFHDFYGKREGFKHGDKTSGTARTSAQAREARGEFEGHAARGPDL